MENLICLRLRFYGNCQKCVHFSTISDSSNLKISSTFSLNHNGACGWRGCLIFNFVKRCYWAICSQNLSFIFFTFFFCSYQHFCTCFPEVFLKICCGRPDVHIVWWYFRSIEMKIQSHIPLSFSSFLSSGELTIRFCCGLINALPGYKNKKIMM